VNLLSRRRAFGNWTTTRTGDAHETITRGGRRAYALHNRMALLLDASALYGRGSYAAAENRLMELWREPWLRLQWLRSPT
jgi:hypothetical protein